MNELLRVSSAVMALATALLAGCGGSGDAPSAVVEAAPLASSGPAQVAAGSAASLAEELAAFNLLNGERDRCGFGTLARNSQLDAAARAHADYQILNGLITHLEDQAQYPNGFTGADPATRIRVQGYSGTGGVADEIYVLNGANTLTGVGERGVRGLLNAPYHLQGLMSGYRDIGMAVRTTQIAQGPAASVYLQINAAYKAAAGPQRLGSTQVLTYPCQGSSGVDRQLSNEEPNPVPGRNLRVNPLGSSVYVALQDGNTLTITSASMLKASTGDAIALRPPITSFNDPCRSGLQSCFRSHEGYIVPDASLEANTAYQVGLQGTNNGTPFSRTFSFTTGTGG